MTLTTLLRITTLVVLAATVTLSAVAEQHTQPPQSFSVAMGMLTDEQLKAWLERNVAGLDSYEPDEDYWGADPREPPHVATTLRRYTWRNCDLQVQEERLAGTWLHKDDLETTAVVAMTDVAGVSSGIGTAVDGIVTLNLTDGSPSTGNLRRGRVVRLFVRYPQVVSSVLLRYTQVCKRTLR